MGLQGLDPAVGVFANGFSGILKYAWVLLFFVVIFGTIGILWWIKQIRNKKNQWTHKLKVRRVLEDNKLTKPIYHNMRRFPIIKNAEVFELEKPLLGGYLMPELDKYTGLNEFSIILDTNNRIYTETGEFFCPDKKSVNVSAKHSEIDISRSHLRTDFQNINKVSKRIEWSQIAKYAFMIMGIMCITIISIVAISKWGEAQEYKSREAQSMEKAMDHLGEAMLTIEGTVNTQKLEILPMMKEIYKTNNIQGIINEEIELDGNIEED